MQPSCNNNGSVKPNIILISIDCLNHRQFDTAVNEGYAPSFAALEADATQYDRAYAHAPWTTPSHMSMLTGLYPSQHGRDVPYGLMIRQNDYYPRLPSFETLAQRLGNEGYETAAFVGQGSISGIYGLDQGFEIFNEHRKENGTWTDLNKVSADAEQWLAARNDNPFFLFFHTYDLHGPRPTGLESDRDAIQYIDQYIERLVLQLKSQGVYDSTLIIFTGDHGSEMIETDGKCCVHGAGHYEENLRVPLLIKFPFKTEEINKKTIARHIDLVPTIMDVADLKPTYDGPGTSLLRPLEGERMSFSEADGRCSLRRALVTDRYKYIYTLNDERQALLQQDETFFDETCKTICLEVPTEELYDLMKDPFEKQNLLEGRLTMEREKHLASLRHQMSQHLNLPHYYTEGVVTGPRNSLDENERKELNDALKALGYIN